MEIEVVALCRECGTMKAITVPDEGYMRWKKGELIQVAMPNVSAEDRELLISHICPKCWKVLFPPEEDEDEDEFSPNSILKE